MNELLQIAQSVVKNDIWPLIKSLKLDKLFNPHISY